MTVSTKRFRRAIGLVLAGAMLSGSVAAQDFPDVTAISLEDLMNLKVTSVSKREQKLADAAAAIFVITQDDIRRSGARTIPEALRLVPGLQVARIDENKWAIASRGFNGRFTNKLLVLIDGRSVYTPLFSGVYWNVQDVLLEDVDRIEVIRGPGATLWGANAVNGVINIMTKPSDATQGGLVTAQAGDALRGAGQVRFGGKLGANVSYRAYSKYFKWDSSTDESGRNAFDGWDTARMGFRLDGGSREGDAFTVQGDIYDGQYGETLTGALLTAPYATTFRNDGRFSGGNVLGRWRHSFGDSSTSLQMYFDRANNAHSALLNDHLNTYDVDFQHDIRINPNHDWIWGVGYRLTQGRRHSGYVCEAEPQSADLEAVQRIRAGRVHDVHRPAPCHGRLEVRTQRLHRGRSGAERACAVESDREPGNLGRRVASRPHAGADRTGHAAGCGRPAAVRRVRRVAHSRQRVR